MAGSRSQGKRASKSSSSSALQEPASRDGEFLMHVHHKFALGWFLVAMRLLFCQFKACDEAPIGAWTGCPLDLPSELDVSGGSVPFATVILFALLM